MSIYTDARSKPGAKAGAGDERALFLTEFGGMVFQAYMELMDYQEMRFIKHITQGKADTFPVIGRKRDATEHVPGELIVGGTITHDEILISLDNMLIDSAFIAEVDELMAHYALGEPYAKQIGQSLGSATAKRIAIMHILASRDVTPIADMPIPAYFWHANLKTDAAQLERAAFLSQQYMLENDMSGENPHFMLPHQQVLLMSRYTGLEGGGLGTGSANRAAGTMGQVAGLPPPRGTNHIPKTNITTGLTKYRGDFSTTVGHIGSKMAVGSLERRGLKVTMKQQDERLGTLIIGSMFNGHGPLRRECSIELRTDAIGGRASLS